MSRRPHANKQAGMGSFTGSGSGDTCFRAILRAYTAESTSPSRHGHSIRKRNSVSSAVMDLKLYFPLSCPLCASTSRLSHARTTSPATHCRKPLRVKRFTRSWKMLRMHASMHVRQHCPCWMQSTQHNTESVYPSWVILYMIINITMLQIMHIKLLVYINPESNYYFGVH